MFTKPLTQIITLKSLKKAYSFVKKSSVGLDMVSVEVFEEDLEASLQEIIKEVKNGNYTPEPLSRIYVPKEQSFKLRPLGLGSIKDKILQRAIATELSTFFEKEFSNKSYGYRVNKSTLQAINRVKDYITKGGVYIYRLDIENFFETLPHEKLLNLLATRIADPALLHIIALFLKNGSFERYKYIEHFEGIHQGDPLSPLLANIYLNQLDCFLENSDIDFVRFADDLVLFANTSKEIEYIQKQTNSFLTKLDLSPNIKKSKKLHAIKEGFDFLGIHFKGWQLSIAKAKLEQIITKQNQIVKSIHPFSEMLKKLNQHLQGLKNYYYEILTPQDAQFKLLQESLLIVLSSRVALERKRGNITTKRAFRELLNDIELPYTLAKSAKKDYIERIITRGLLEFLESKKYKKATKKIAKKKREYAKKYATASVLYVSEFGTFIGVAKNSIVLKQKGKVIFKMPKTHCERIIIASNSVSISSALVKLCATLGITIDFIDAKANQTPYASIYTNKNAYASMSLKQLKILNTPKQLKLAKAFIKGKVKNQINYLIYLNKYHKLIDEDIKLIKKHLTNMLLFAKTPNELMGFEGTTAQIYWSALAKIVDDKIDFKGRVTYGAKDIVNSALNYGYAFLYSRVQYHLIRAGLSLHISFLHALNDNKPTLVYDLIEEFRAFVVDRVIFTMINQREPLTLDKNGLLDLPSRQKIAKKVLEKIGSYTKHKKASKKIDTIISEQAYLLARAVKGLSTYKPFIGKY